MSNVADRKRAAKDKLDKLAIQRKEAKVEEQARKDAKIAARAKAKSMAVSESASVEQSAPTDSGGVASSKKKKKKVFKKTAEDIAPAAVDAMENGAEKLMKRGRKRKGDQEIIIVQGREKRTIVTELVPIDVPVTLGADAYREKHNVICGNSECPPPLETFEAAEACIGIHFVTLLKERGFVAPSPIQAQAWPLALAGRDIVGIAQTGSGKTLAYLLPILVRFRERGKPSTAVDPALPSALVLAPTRELIQQIASDVAKLAISIGRRFVPCFGGVWKGAQLKQLGKGCDILLSTPGRLKDFMLGDKAKGHPPAVDVANVSYLILDEADAMLAMGFMEQVRDIVSRCKHQGEPEQGGAASGTRAGSARQTLFFTATWPVKVKAAAREFTTKHAAQLRIGQGVGHDKLTANKNVRQIVQMVEYWDKMARLINVLTTELKQGDTCLVFCSTKGRTEYVVDELNRSHVVDWCDGIHSGKEQPVRDTTLEYFRRHTANGDCRAVLVATDVAARGIDIPGVALVVVYDLNGWNGELNIDSYVHRIGRTGRAGKMGRAYTFVESKDRGLPDLVKLLEDAGQRIPVPLQDVEISERHPLGEKGSGEKLKRTGKGKADIRVDGDPPTSRSNGKKKKKIKAK